MRRRDSLRLSMLRAPWWAMCLLAGVVWGVPMAGVQLLQHGWGGALVAVPGAVGFGLLMGTMAHRQAAAARAELAGLTSEQQLAALNASRSGHPPADPNARRAAAALVGWQATRWRRNRRWSLTLLGGLAVVGAVGAVVLHAAFAVLALVLGAVLALTEVLGRLLERRAEDLGRAAAAGPAAD